MKLAGDLVDLLETYAFLSAKELGISARTRKGLIRIRDELLDGTLVHIPVYKAAVGKDDPLYGRMFNMRFWGGGSGCGSVHCIGGWLDARGQVGRSGTDTLYDLFCPPTDMASWWCITPKQAAKAIENFLQTGKPDWHSVLS